jgi:methionyl-tRNA formyltransferase
MKIWDAEVSVMDVEMEDVNPGTIVKVDKDSFYVQTGEGLLKVCELQIPGKKRMDAGAFLRGYQVKEGEIL